MRWYLAASFTRQEEMREFRNALLAAGEEVQARWVTSDDHKMEDQPTDDARARCAIEDLDDIAKSDGIINFTNNVGQGKRNRGGRHAEFGVGLALNKRMVLIGPREHVFHYLPSVEIYSDFDAFMEEGLV
jgi:hypothetical protein